MVLGLAFGSGFYRKIVTRLLDVICNHGGKMKSLVTTLLGLALTFLASLAFAAQPLVTDDTGTVGIKKFQLETSAEFGWDREAEHGIATKSNHQTLSTTASIGVFNSIDMVVSLPFSRQHIEATPGNNSITNGINDLSLAFKWRFFELGHTSLAIKPTIFFPTGNRDKRLGSGRVGYGASLISSVEFYPVAIHANVGSKNQKYTDADKDGEREHLWNVSFAGTVKVLKGLQLVAEIGTASNQDKNSAALPTFISGGIIYSVLEHLDLDFGVKGGLNTPETDITLLSGVTINFL